MARRRGTKKQRTRRKVCVCTGARSEYGILRPVMRQIKKSRQLALQVVAAGMHLAREFGHTVDEIEADGFVVAERVPMLPSNDTLVAMSESVGRGIVGFTRAFAKLGSEIVVVLGDRTEAFAAAVAACLSGRILAHIHGGDRAEAGYDDYMRHAITKMAHVHFAATAGSAERIAKMGEDRRRIFTVGAPGLDEIRPLALPPAEVTKRRLGFDPRDPLILCVQHSVSTHPQDSAAEMRETLSALTEIALPTVVIYPNSDAGGRAIIRVIRSWEADYGREHGKWLAVYKSLPREEFFAVMKAASVMVGNSSSGIIEAASFGLPVVNVGRRQAGRERSGNTIDVPPRRDDVERAISRIIHDIELRKWLSRPKNIYGDGKASVRIRSVLERIGLGGAVRRKQITY